jgi:TnpA family transposase
MAFLDKKVHVVRKAVREKLDQLANVDEKETEEKRAIKEFRYVETTKYPLNYLKNEIYCIKIHRDWMRHAHWGQMVYHFQAAVGDLQKLVQ